MNIEESLKEAKLELSLTDKEEVAVRKYYEFLEGQEKTEERKEIKKNYSFSKAAEINPEENEKRFYVLVDPFESEDWNSMCIGFLAAHGILGDRSSEIAAKIRG